MVDVYGSQKMLDSIKYIYTERINIKNLKDTIRRDLDLMEIRGVKCVPSRVRMAVYPDVLTEESAEVPISASPPAILLPQSTVHVRHCLCPGTKSRTSPHAASAQRKNG